MSIPHWSLFHRVMFHLLEKIRGRYRYSIAAITDLIAGHHEVDDPEVVLEPVAHKDGARIHQEAQLLVRGLQRGQMLGAEVGIQVTRLDARELGQVVHNLEKAENVGVHTVMQSRPPPPFLAAPAPGDPQF